MFERLRNAQNDSIPMVCTGPHLTNAGLYGTVPAGEGGEETFAHEGGTAL